MTIDREDAVVIVEMAQICYSEGLGPDWDSLLGRIAAEFDAELVPDYLQAKKP